MPHVTILPLSLTLFLLPHPLCLRSAAEEASETGSRAVDPPLPLPQPRLGAIACPIASCASRRNGRCCVGRAWRSPGGSTWRGHPGVCSAGDRPPMFGSSRLRDAISRYCMSYICPVLNLSAMAMRAVVKAKGEREDSRELDVQASRKLLPSNGSKLSAFHSSCLRFESDHERTPVPYD